MQFITILSEVVEQAEKAKGYWDETGLDMHIAVVPCDTNENTKAETKLVVSTKHWSRVHYINSSLSANEVWSLVRQISQTIGRSLIKSNKGSYVYINNLNIEQTKSIFDIMKSTFGDDVDRIWELSWDIDDAVLPEN